MRIRRRIGELHQFQFALAVEHHAAHRFLRLFLLMDRYWTGKRDRPRADKGGQGRTEYGLARHMEREAVWLDRRLSGAEGYVILQAGQASF